MKIVKCKIDAKQGHEASFFIRYGYGIDDLYSIIMAAEANGVIKREGAYYTYNNERIQGRDKLRAHLLANPKLSEELRAKVIEAITAALPTAISDDELSDEDKLVVQRARKIQQFLSQPFNVAEQFTGTPGEYVPIADTVRGFGEILDGKDLFADE